MAEALVRSRSRAIPQALPAALAYAMATAVFNIAPLIVGALVDERQLALAPAGRVVSVELVSMGLTALFVAPWVARVPRRRTLSVAAAGLLLANLLSMVSFELAGFVATRVLAGIGAGVLLSLVNTFAVEARDPVRFFGELNISMTLVSVLFLVGMPFLIASLGIGGVLLPLALVAALVLGLSAFVEEQWADDLPSQIPFPMFRMLCLVLAIIAIAAAQMACYAYAERIATGLGMSPGAIGLVLSLTYVIGVLGSFFAAAIGGRFGSFGPISILSLAVGVTCLLLATAASQSAFVLALFGLSLAFFMLSPFVLGVSTAWDPKGRLTAFTTSLFFAAMGLGPLLGGMLVPRYGFDALGFSALALAIAAIPLFRVATRPVPANRQRAARR